MNELWRPLYPFKPRRFETSAGHMSYLDEGSGETVLMVHGNPTWSFYFRELVKALRPTHRCVVPDHIGMGLSARPDDARYKFTLKSRVDDLDALMKAVAPEGPVILILHDWGGMIGMGWAARHPERVKAVVALNTSCFRLPMEKRLMPLLGVMRGPFGLPLRFSRLARRSVLNTCVARAPLSAAVESAYLQVCDGWNESRAVQRFVQDIPLKPGDPAWDQVLATEAALGKFLHAPMLLPWGTRDWVFDSDFLRGWTARFPSARVQRYDDCGHFLLEDAPERVVPLIADFVAKPVAA